MQFIGGRRHYGGLGAPLGAPSYLKRSGPLGVVLTPTYVGYAAVIVMQFKCFWQGLKSEVSKHFRPRAVSAIKQRVGGREENTIEVKIKKKQNSNVAFGYTFSNILFSYHST